MLLVTARVYSNCSFIMEHSIFFFVFAFASVFVHRTIAQGTYSATVMEYAKTGDTSSDYDNLIKRTEEYVSNIQKSRSHIIVFPEYGLTTPNLPENLEEISTVVPEASKHASPCANTQGFGKHLIDLSCAARTHQRYVVVNLIEKAYSTTNTTIYYNTNVVFSNDGTVIARYRKMNLCNEPQFTRGEDLSTFDAFGVKFGLTTSCDLLFSHPTLTLLDQNVTDVVCPHAWTSETPFLQVLSFQDGFAKATGINLLSAGYSNSTAGMGGAAIFLANATYATMDISTTIVASRNAADVQKIDARTPGKVCENNIDREPRIGGVQPGIESFNTKTEDLALYTILDLETSQRESKVQVCSEGSLFCCDFYVKFKEDVVASNTPVYKVAAFYGTKRVSATSQTLGLRTCALLACATSDSSTCGQRPANFNVSFETITIKANLPKGGRSLYLPTTLRSDLKPVKNYAYCQNDNKEEDTLGTTMSIENVDNLLTFGIFGRVYELDGQPEGRGSGSYVRSAFGLIIALLVSHFLIQ